MDPPTGHSLPPPSPPVIVITEVIVIVGEGGGRRIRVGIRAADAGSTSGGRRGGPPPPDPCRDSHLSRPQCMGRPPSHASSTSLGKGEGRCRRHVSPPLVSARGKAASATIDAPPPLVSVWGKTATAIDAHLLR